jgi:hypothetical protein
MFARCERECREARFWLAQIRNSVRSHADLAWLFEDDAKVHLNGFAPLSRAPDYSYYCWGYQYGLRCTLTWNSEKQRLDDLEFSCNICVLDAI